MQRNLDEVFAALEQSSFRRRFRLRGKELAYLRHRGLPVVLEHAAEPGDENSEGNADDRGEKEVA